MTDAYEILGLPSNSDDEAIRRQYLKLVREFSPERHPEKFSQIRQAYEQLKDLDTRLRHRLFEAGRGDSVEAIVEELACQSSRRRMSLEKLFQMYKKV